jgi:hypothetical protein
MALARQNFTLQFGQGVDTKTDPKQIQIGKLAELENATFQSTNRLTKRPGSAQLAASSSPAQGNAIASFRDELVVMDGSSVSSYGKQFDNLIAKGTKVAIDVTAESIIKNSYQQTYPDSCLLNGLSAYVWQDSQGGCHYSVFDNATQQLIVNNEAIAGASNPKLVGVGDSFAIVYVEAGGTSYIKARVVDALSPLSLPVTVTLATISNTNQFYDVSSNGSFAYLAYTDGSGNLACVRFDDSFTPSSPLTLAVTANQKAMVLGSFGNLRVGYSTGTDVRFVTVDAGLTTFGTPVVIEAVAGVVNLTAIETANTTFKWYYEVDATNAYDHYVRACTVSNLTPGTPADFNRSVGIWSKVFSYGSDHYIVLVHESELQDTYFVFNSSGAIVAKIAPDNGGNLSYNGTLREVNAQAGGKFEFAYLIKDLVASIGGDVYTQTGVNSAVLTFGNQIFTESLGNNLNTSGGIVSAYDGQSVVEQNFFLYPENLEVEQYNSPGLLGQGQYQYCATYEWTDAQGQLHVSAPSVAVTVDTVPQLNTTTPYATTPNQTIGPTIGPLTSYPVAYYGPGTPPFDVLPNDIQIGQVMTGGPLPINTYFRDIYRVAFNTTHYAIFNQAVSNATYPVLTITNNFRYGGSTTFNSDIINLSQATTATYIGDITAGSNVIKFNTTTNLKIGMVIDWAGSAFTSVYGTFITITAINGNLVTVNQTATASVIGQNIFAQMRITVNFYNGLTYFDYSPGAYPPLVSPGQRVCYENDVYQFATVTSIIDLGGNNYRCFTDFTFPFTGTGVKFMVCLTQAHALSIGQTIQTTAGFIGNLKVKSVGITTIQVDKTCLIAGTTNLEVVATAGQSAILTIPTLRITNKPIETPVSVAVYRTLLNETLFYRVSSFIAPLLNNKTIDSVTLVDGLADDVVLGNEQLYTTGGVLANGQAPASSLVAQYKNRLISVSSEDPFTWYFSKPVGTNTPVQFSPFFYKKIPELGGPITALGVMDDKLIFFKRSSIFIVVGTGPNNLGLQDDFNDAELVTTDTGCLEPKSVVRMPLGLMYKSAKGIYLLDRGLNVKYIGDEVESYNSDTVTSSELIEQSNQVRFTLSSGKSLVYDYYFDQWSVFTNQNAADSTIFEGKFTYLRPDGKIYKETPGVWTDGGQPIYLKLKTAWLSFNGLQGLERLYNTMVLGEYKSPHTLTVKVAHDFGADSQTTVIPVATNPGLYQYKVYLNRQKSQSVQFTVNETQSGAPYGEGLNISALGLEVGVKKGLNTLPAGKLYG